MSLFKKLGRLLGKTSRKNSDENWLETEKGRKEAQSMLEGMERDLKEGLVLNKEQVAFYKRWEDTFRAGIQRTDKLQGEILELQMGFQNLSKKLKQSMAQSKSLIEKLEDLQVRWKSLNETSPTYEADKSRLLEERKRLEEELNRLETGSANS